MTLLAYLCYVLGPNCDPIVHTTLMIRTVERYLSY